MGGGAVTFTGRIRIYLLAAAILPMAVLMLVVWHFGNQQAERWQLQTVRDNLSQFQILWAAWRTGTVRAIDDLVADPDFAAMVRAAADNRSRFLADPDCHNLDFCEIVDTNGVVLASWHRPGLIGQPVSPDKQPGLSQTATLSIEYDLRGEHAALVKYLEFGRDVRIYCGRYLPESWLVALPSLIGADSVWRISPTDTVAATTAPGQVYVANNKWRVRLLGSKEDPFAIVAQFASQPDHVPGQSLLPYAALAGLLSLILAIGMGMIITGKAKREIDNLLRASSRVAGGDFSQPVMAYEEGEFAQLADSMTEMMDRLKKLQRQLVVSEQIAAWQLVGRKVAHEIKNPLTPISIGIDDLHRSYAEGQADFDQILTQTVTTVRSELRRMTTILDQFVGFARMKPPEIRDVALTDLVSLIRRLYKAEHDAGRLLIETKDMPDHWRCDPDTMRQVLVNLIKNGLESEPRAKVTVTVSARQDRLCMVIVDNGPGFPPDRLSRPFEPYQTTKEGGNGLGLVIAYRIVHDHQGTMQLNNLPNRGAEVRIELPD